MTSGPLTLKPLAPVCPRSGRRRPLAEGTRPHDTRPSCGPPRAVSGGACVLGTAASPVPRLTNHPGGSGHAEPGPRAHRGAEPGSRGPGRHRGTEDARARLLGSPVDLVSCSDWGPRTSHRTQQAPGPWAARGRWGSDQTRPGRERTPASLPRQAPAVPGEPHQTPRTPGTNGPRHPCAVHGVPCTRALAEGRQRWIPLRPAGQEQPGFWGTERPDACVGATPASPSPATRAGRRLSAAPQVQEGWGAPRKWEKHSLWGLKTGVKSGTPGHGRLPGPLPAPPLLRVASPPPHCGS